MFPNYINVLKNSKYMIEYIFLRIEIFINHRNSEMTIKMKSKTSNLLFLSVLSLIMFTSFVSATVLSEWSLNSSGSATSVNANVNAGSFTSVGVSTVTYNADGAYASSWATGDINASKYYQITLSPKSGYDLTISSIDFNERRSTTGIRNYQVKYSKNSDFSSATTLVTESVADDENERAKSISTSISVNDSQTIIYTTIISLI